MSIYEFVDRLWEQIKKDENLQRAYLNNAEFHHLVDLGRYLNKEPLSLGQMRDQLISELEAEELIKNKDERAWRSQYLNEPK